MISSLTKLLRGRNLTSKVMSRIKTFVFLDLETTGLPHLEHNKTKITEMCVIAVQADHIELGCFPRVHNKLTFCFNPRKMIQQDSTDITGLSNELLEHQTFFNADIVNILVKWLETNQPPICLVAHNGSRFDYPILRAEVRNVGCELPEDILCVDSLVAFRALDRQKEEEKEKLECEKESKEVPFEFDDGYDEILCQIGEEMEMEDEEKKKKYMTPEEVQQMNETTPKKQKISEPCSNSRTERASPKKKANLKKLSLSYQLKDIYSRLTDRPPLQAHEAEADVVMLVTCAAAFGERFVDYANENSKCLSDIPPMMPGKKIGT